MVRIVCLAWLAILLNAPLAAAQWSVPTIDVDDIKPGMKGYGLTVFRGTKPERFDIEVIDVLHDFRPAQDLILIRTPHPILNRARGVGGMSGSPIYIDGRLAGAYAYGWSYGIDPVVGVTPIKNMLGELKRPLRKNAGHLSHNSIINSTAFTTAERIATRHVNPHGTPGITHTATPLMIGGFTEQVAAMLTERFKKFGLIPMQGASGGDRRVPKATKYEAGGAIAVELARGDVSVSGIGTVTYVGTKGRVLAFGHPMLDAGQVNIPTANARVLHILANEQRSFKIAESLAPNGSLVHDRQATIVVDTRVRPTTIPVQIRVHGVRGAPKTKWNVAVASHPALTPMLIFGVIANALNATASDHADVIFKATTRIGIENHGTVTLTDHGFVTDGPSSGGVLSTLRAFPLINATFDNAFETSRVTSLDMDLSVEFSRDVLQVIDVSVPSEEIEAGTTIPVYVRIRRVDRGEETRTFSLDIPEHAAGKKVRITVQPGPAVPIPTGQPRSLDDLIQIVKRRYPATSLVVSLNLPSRGLQFQGHVVDSLPPSALDALQVGHMTSAPKPFTTQSRHELKMGKLVIGGGILQLKVREHKRGQ